MSREYDCIIGDHAYTGTTASAKSQFEALHICMRTGYIATLDGSREFSEAGVVTLFVQMSFEDVQKLVSLVVKGCIKRQEDGVPVAENLFTDNIEHYYLLLHRALAENIGGFWKLQRQTESKALEPEANSTPA